MFDIQKLKQETLLALDPSGLSRDQIGWLSRAQIGGLSPAQIGGLLRAQLGGLSPDQLGWLSPDQAAAIFGDASIPKVEKLYSKMLAGIRDAKRKLDQSTFGPDEDAGENLCDTPMCIAGHTVNLAGAAGYALKDRFSFEAAARLIHRASCPDTPEPLYGNYPSAWALSYIEEMARLEDESA